MFHAFGEDGKVANRDEVQEAYNLLDEIKGYAAEGKFLHYDSIRQAFEL